MKVCMQKAVRGDGCKQVELRKPAGLVAVVSFLCSSNRHDLEAQSHGVAFLSGVGLLGMSPPTVQSRIRGAGVSCCCCSV